MCTPVLQAAKRIKEATATRELVYFSCDVLVCQRMKGLAMKWLEDGQRAGHL